MKQMFTASVWQEGDWFVAQCLEVDMASQGETEAEALDSFPIRLFKSMRASAVLAPKKPVATVAALEPYHPHPE